MASGILNLGTRLSIQLQDKAALTPVREPLIPSGCMKRSEEGIGEQSRY